MAKKRTKVIKRLSAAATEEALLLQPVLLLSSIASAFSCHLIEDVDEILVSLLTSSCQKGVGLNAHQLQVATLLG